MTDRDLSEARHLIDLYAARVRLTKELAAMERATGADVDAVLAAGRTLDEACEAYRLKHHRRAGRISVGLYSVFVVTPGGRKAHRVLDMFEEYCGDREEVPA